MPVTEMPPAAISDLAGPGRFLELQTTWAMYGPAITQVFGARSTAGPEDASAASARIDSERQRALAEIHRYSKYPRSWDGYRAEPFSIILLDAATAMVDFIASHAVAHAWTPDLITTGPGADGSIDIEIRRKSRTLILTLDPSFATVRIYREDHGARQEYTRTFSIAFVAKELDWLAR